MHFAPAPVATGGPEFDGFEPRVLESTVGSGAVDWHLALLLALSGVGSLVVFALALSAFRRRRSLPYLLITAALGALVLRPIVGTGTVLGYVPMDLHHTVEHLLDVVIAGLLIAAVVSVGSLERGSRGVEETEESR
ncbi:DUF7471 family protein [Natrononativus amylolyticus]|uniref:DUF7471 family protein n=1 Tax=Natrononativus amylolyticus TaxID=2963434 RepID=UPI0020CC85BD|nr:hypothetical protein [Natrononativus amylolyticus]